jgi:hypothetical protein
VDSAWRDAWRRTTKVAEQERLTGQLQKSGIVKDATSRDVQFQYREDEQDQQQRAFSSLARSQTLMLAQDCFEES